MGNEEERHEHNIEQRRRQARRRYVNHPNESMTGTLIITG